MERIYKLMVGFKCMNKGCKTVMYANGKMYWKWKDKTHMTQQHVCKPCWDKARSLKVLEKNK
jgi:hypothetical protein